MAISSAWSAEQSGYSYMVVIGIERVVMVEKGVGDVRTERGKNLAVVSTYAA